MAVIHVQWLVVPFVVFSFLSPFKEVKMGKDSGIHPFYVSVTEVNHNSKDKTLEISCKIFADDLEEILKKNYQTTIDLTNEQQHVRNDQLIKDYISRHLALTTDGRKVSLSYVGFEKEAEAVYCYFEVRNTSVVKTIDVYNSILQDFTPQQINILHVIVGGQRKSFKLDYPNKLATFNF